MNERLMAWQRSAIRRNMAHYRRAQEDYCLQGKPLTRSDDGYEAFSLVSPPLGSPVTRRRVRLIVDNMVKSQPHGETPANMPVGSRTPHVVTIAVNYNCQCRCGHCSAAAYRDEVERRRSAMRPQELKSVIVQAVDMGATCIILTGGEPLLLPEICELVGAVDKARSICTLFTNGEYLDAAMAARLKASGLFGVFVSFDHPDAGRHDRNRKRTGIFDKAVRAVGEARTSGLLTGISTFATHENIHNGELDAMMDLAKALGVLEVFLFDVIPAGELAGRRDCMLSDADADAIREFRGRFSALADYPRVIHQTMFSAIAYPCLAEGCPAGIMHMHVRANGDVTPCDFTPLSFGNVREQPLSQAWDRIASSPLYAGQSPRCRLSRPGFWTELEAQRAALSA